MVFITGAYGLGENIVQGTVDPDEFYVHKPTFRQGYRAVLPRRHGRKQMRLVCAEGHTRIDDAQCGDQAANSDRFCLTMPRCWSLPTMPSGSKTTIRRKAGHPMPMDIEWAKDGEDGKLYIVQARPETVASRRDAGAFETYALKRRVRCSRLASAVGEKIAAGMSRVITDQRQLAEFRPGEVLVARATTPDWEPVMKSAAAIVTDRGGRTCHAAIVARELGVPAVVGLGDATTELKTGMPVTVDCAEGEDGRCLPGAALFSDEDSGDRSPQNRQLRSC